MRARAARFSFAMAAALSLTLGVSTIADAITFSPFTKVEDVCPSCEKRPAATIEMSDGRKVRASIIAENTSFYVLQRYGEIRAIRKSSVTSIEWPGGEKPAGLTNQDQIVLKNGHIITGNIIDERDKPPYFKIKASHNNRTYVAFKSQVQEIYKSGDVYDFTQ